MKDRARMSPAGWMSTSVIALALLILATVLAACSSAGKTTGPEAVDGSTTQLASATASASSASIASPRKSVRVLAVTTGNRFLRAALPDDYFDVVTVTPAEYPTTRGAFDVTVFDRVAPEVLPDSGAVFYIHPSGPHSPVDSTGTLRDDDENASLGFDTVTSTSPIVRFVDGLDNVNVAEAMHLVPRPEDQIIGASTKGPLLIAGSRGNHRFVVLAVDLSQTDLALRIAWPMLLGNAIGDLVGKDVYSLRRSNIAPPAAASSAESPSAAGAGSSAPTHRDIIEQAGERGFTGPSYSRVYREYREVARDELERKRLPVSVRYYVERYLDAIRPTD